MSCRSFKIWEFCLKGDGETLESSEHKKKTMRTESFNTTLASMLRIDRRGMGAEARFKACS